MNTIEAFQHVLIFRDALNDNLCDDYATRAKHRRNYLRFRRAFIARLKECDRAREALLDVEWIRHIEDGQICPWCDGNKHWDGHAPDCPRQLALGISNVTE